MFALFPLLHLTGIGSFISANWKLLLMAAGAAVIGIFAYSWDSRGRQLVSLKLENAVLQSNIEVMKTQAQLAKEANEKAVEVQVQDKHTDEAVTQIIEESNHAPPSDDAPIAPVLFRGLSDIGKLLDSASNRH